MTSELTQTLLFASRGLERLIALRSGEGNPNHKGTGPGGGQFTSGGGGGGGASKPHGKHWARRQRRKKRLLAKLKAKAHLKIAKVKAAHRAERKALREKHRSEGTNYKQQRSERRELSAKQKGERQGAVKELRAEVRKEAQALKVAKPEGADKSAKAKEFAAGRERIDAKVAEFRKDDIKDWNKQRSEITKRHSEERQHFVEQSRGERSEIREGFAREVKDIRQTRNEQWKQELSDTKEWAAKNKDRDISAWINSRHQEIRDLAKEDYSATKETYREQISEHKETVASERARLEKRQAREIDFHDYLARKSINQTASMTRKQAIDALKKKLGSPQRSIESEVIAIRSGNPNHDNEGKFASGPGGGHGKHWVKRQRRKKTLARLKRQGHAEIAEMRGRHKGEWKALIGGQRKEWKAQGRTHLKERNTLRREHRRDKTSRAERQTEHANLRGEQRDERASLKEDHQVDRKSTKDTNREERHELLSSLKDEIRERFPKRKAAGGGDHLAGNRNVSASMVDSPDHRISNALDRVLSTGRTGGNRARFGSSRLHKASSAESILQHVLRQRGWSAKWREGRLTGRQHLQLLEDIRQYGRQWLRHEAEAFFGRYGDGGQIRAITEASEAHGENWQYETSREAAGVCDSSARAAGGIDGQDTQSAPSEQLARAYEVATRSLSTRILSPLKRWFDRTRQFVRELIFGGAIALKGTELTAQEAEQAEDLSKIQAQYLDGFEREIIANPPRELAEPTAQIMPPIPGAKPPMSPAQIGARAELYATSAWQGAQKIQRAASRKTGSARWERRVLGHPKTEHCTDCPPLAALGWQPVGTLPDIGDSECNGLCLCHFEYSDDIAMPEARKPKPTPKPTRPKAIAQPPAKAEVIQPAPTREEIDAEVKKWIAGEPSKLTVKVKYPRAPEPEPELPPGYEWSE